jgi:hypothetical protein
MNRLLLLRRHQTNSYSVATPNSGSRDVALETIIIISNRSETVHDASKAEKNESSKHYVFNPLKPNDYYIYHPL